MRFTGDNRNLSVSAADHMEMKSVSQTGIPSVGKSVCQAGCETMN
jgi:hypothetical protein